MAFVVVVTEKGGKPRQEPFDQAEILIGRVVDNDICLPKGNISKRHARIVLRDGKLIIVDLKSTNGTFVNGKRIASPQVLKESDKIYIGNFTLQLEPARGPLPPRSPRPQHDRDERTNPGSEPVLPPPVPPSSSEQDAPTPPVGTRIPDAARGPNLPASITRAVLVVARAGAVIAEFPLTKAVTGLGRHPENDVVLDDRTLARFHLRVERRADRYFVLDLGAASGVHVNGARITSERALSTGDVMRAGHYDITFAAPMTPATVTPSAPPSVAGHVLIGLLQDVAVEEITAQPNAPVRVTRAHGVVEQSAVSAEDIARLLSVLGVQLSRTQPIFDGPAPNQSRWIVTARDFDQTGAHVRLRRAKRFTIDDDVDPVAPG